MNRQCSVRYEIVDLKTRSRFAWQKIERRGRPIDFGVETRGALVNGHWVILQVSSQVGIGIVARLSLQRLEFPRRIMRLIRSS